MKLSGLQSRFITENSHLEFDLSMSLDKINGFGEFGFSGENQILKFDFISGKIYDFEKNYVYSYKENESINIIGDIQTGSYIYYINDQPVGINNKNNFIISKFFTNSKDCVLDIDLVLKSEQPKYDVILNSYYYTGQYLTGSFINYNQDYNLRIFSGQVTQNTGFKLISAPHIVSGTGNILILPNITPATYNIRLYLDCDFGRINKVFTVSGLTN